MKMLPTFGSSYSWAVSSFHEFGEQESGTDVQVLGRGGRCAVRQRALDEGL